MNTQRRPTLADWKAREARVRPKVEKGIPVPVTRNRYSFDEMEHGDSVWVPWSEADRRRRSMGNTRSQVVNAAHQWLRANRPGWDCTTRTEGEGTRVWFTDPAREDV